MAQLVTVKLSKADSQPWGFRLQGGKDFGTPLLLQKVNSGSIADKAGLVAGDAVIKVNNVELYNLRHKDAQDAIVRSGNSFELTIQRGGSTWKPSVTPVGNVPSPVSSLGSVTPVTRTSLAATPQNMQHIGCGYNSAAQPFSNNGVKSIVNKQYNTPVGMYSDETIAETLSAQAEVLAGGVLGVNFKKNERIYNAANSEVLKALNEQDNDPEPDGSSSFSPVSVSQSNSVTKHVFAPVDKPQAPSNGLPAGQNICSDCERLIVGVFVRIKDKNLHVECFKCATCGASLKNQGYYNINNKLYCDIHARIQAALSPPPNSNGMVPVTIPPKPISANTISAALNAHAGNLNGSGTTLPSQPSSLGGPRPYGFSTSAAPKSPAMAPQSPSYPPSAPWSAPKPVNPPTPVISQSFGENNQGKTILFKPGNNMKGPNKSGFGATTAPKRGRGVLNKAVVGGRTPLCGSCNGQVRGPFITALGRIWCPDHFICGNNSCKRQLADIGFVEEKGNLYCEYCFEQYLAPPCSRCNGKIKGDCLNAIGRKFHPECFTCTYCGKLFGNSPFFLEEGEAYCEADWNELFTTKCFACGFPVEAGDKWVEALNNNYHSQCFNCTMCKKNLEGQSFYAKGGRPFCKNHAR